MLPAEQNVIKNANLFHVKEKGHNDKRVMKKCLTEVGQGKTNRRNQRYDVVDVGA